MTSNRLIACLACLSLTGVVRAETTTVIQHGPAELRRGTLEDAGANTYVSASGGFQTIHRWDLNRDGEIDLVFSQDHNAHYAPDAMIYWSDADGPHSLLPELRSPYTLVKHTEQALKRVSWLPSFGGGRCVIADLNNDGYVDIVSGNMMHNFRQDMPAYIYWGGPDGFRESDRTILPAYIASGIAVGDFNEDGLPDIALANQGFERGFDKRFGEMLNYRESFIYWGHPSGFEGPQRSAVPTIAAADVAAGLDQALIRLSRDGRLLNVWRSPAGLPYAHGICVDRDGFIYATASGKDLWKVEPAPPVASF